MPLSKPTTSDMSICDLLFSLGFFVPSATGNLYNTEDSPAMCYFAAISGQFFGLASLSWYFCITINTFRAMNADLVRTAKYKGLPIGYHAYVSLALFLFYSIIAVLCCFLFCLVGIQLFRPSNTALTPSLFFPPRLTDMYGG